MIDMKTTEIISICALLISIITYWFTYLRDKKKRFQESLFDLKLTAYKEINEQIWAYMQSSLDLLMYMQEYEGTEKEWVKDRESNSHKDYEKAFALKDTITKHYLLLPKNAIKKCNYISDLGVVIVTNSYHFNTAISVENHDKLEDAYAEFVNIARADLGIDTLNKSLKERITFNLNPILAFRKRPKSQKDTDNKND